MPEVLVKSMDPLEYVNTIESASPSSGTFTTVADFVALAFNVALGIGLSLSVIGIILAGIRYLMSGSDIKALTQAKSALFHSILALILVLAGYTIYIIILNLLGVQTEVESMAPGGGGARWWNPSPPIRPL